MSQALLALVAIVAVAAAVVWARSARYRARLVQRLEIEAADDDVLALARSDLRKDVHTTVLYAAVSVACAGGAATADTDISAALLVLVAVPAVASLVFGRNFVTEARLELRRSQLEQRAQEVLIQEELAPRRWADRLAPEALPDVVGLEVGSCYQAGSGLMAGDFYDLVRVGPHRVAAVIGDVAGQGIDPAITAFQAKYLLRVFLRQFRDPSQAVEELNTQMSAIGGPEEFISLCVAVFDTEAKTLRYTSAGHPAAWLWHDREVQPLRSTGPVVMLDPHATFFSREIPLDPHDLFLVSTDGLTEARHGEQLFGEDRVAGVLRRDPGVSPDVLCKSLLEAAIDFAGGSINDDVAILAIRRS